VKLGTENKGRVALLVVLLAVAGALLWRNLAPAQDDTASPPPASGVAARSAVGAANLDPRLHLDELARLRARRYTGSGRDLFRLGPAPPPPLTPAARAALARSKALAAANRAAASGPPPPPPIPLAFYGYAQANGMPEKVFLRFGGETFAAAEGATIAHRYLIENIGKHSVRVKDLMTQNEQELPLQQGGSGATP
jgi:hypothetical protein